MIIKGSESTHEVSDADCSLESSIVELNIPSPFDARCIAQSPVACGSSQFLDSFSLSHLYRQSTFDFNQESLTEDVLCSVQTSD